MLLTKLTKLTVKLSAVKACFYNTIQSEEFVTYVCDLDIVFIYCGASIFVCKF